MPLWLLLVLMALIKLSLAALLLWIPFRSDEAMSARSDMVAGDGPSEDDGGSKTLPGAPGDPHPRHPLPVKPRPRRGPHGSPPAPAPPRVRRAGGDRQVVVRGR